MHQTLLTLLDRQLSPGDTDSTHKLWIDPVIFTEHVAEAAQEFATENGLLAYNESLWLDGELHYDNLKSLLFNCGFTSVEQESNGQNYLLLTPFDKPDGKSYAQLQREINRLTRDRNAAQDLSDQWAAEAEFLAGKLALLHPASKQAEKNEAQTRATPTETQRDLIKWFKKNNVSHYINRREWYVSLPYMSVERSQELEQILENSGNPAKTYGGKVILQKLVGVLEQWGFKAEEKRLEGNQLRRRGIEPRSKKKERFLVVSPRHLTRLS